MTNHNYPKTIGNSQRKINKEGNSTNNSLGQPNIYMSVAFTINPRNIAAKQ